MITLQLQITTIIWQKFKEIEIFPTPPSGLHTKPLKIQNWLTVKVKCFCLQICLPSCMNP